MSYGRRLCESVHAIERIVWLAKALAKLAIIEAPQQESEPAFSSFRGARVVAAVLEKRHLGRTREIKLSVVLVTRDDELIGARWHRSPIVRKICDGRFRGAAAGIGSSSADIRVLTAAVASRDAPCVATCKGPLSS